MREHRQDKDSLDPRFLFYGIDFDVVIELCLFLKLYSNPNVLDLPVKDTASFEV